MIISKDFPKVSFFKFLKIKKDFIKSIILELEDFTFLYIGITVIKFSFIKLISFSLP